MYHINGGSLKIEASNDNFGDPANGVGKKLQVDYKLNDVFVSVTVDEGETLSIPENK